MHEGTASLECYIYLTEIKKKGLICQGGIYSLSGDRCRMDPRVGITRRAWRRLEFPSHIHCSPVWGRVCQEFKALEGVFLRTEGERVRGGAQWDGAKWTHMPEPLSAQLHRSLFPSFLMLCFSWQKSEHQMEMYRNAGVPPKQKLTTFKISDNALIKPGTPNLWLHLTHAEETPM